MQVNLELKGGSARKAYVSPALTVFGALNQLTASGSNNASSESVGNLAMVCQASNMFNANCGM